MRLSKSLLRLRDTSINSSAPSRIPFVAQIDTDTNNRRSVNGKSIIEFGMSLTRDYWKLTLSIVGSLSVPPE